MASLAGLRLFLMNSGVNHASRCLDDITDTQFRVKHFQSLVHSRCYYRIKTISAFSQRCLKKNMSMDYLYSWNLSNHPVSASRVSRKYTSFFGSKGEHHDLQESEVSFPAVSNQSNVHSTDVGGNDDWSANLKKAPQSTEDATVHTREKSEAASSELASHVQQLLHTYHPYLIKAIFRDPYLIYAIIRVGGTLTSIIHNPYLINAISRVGGTLSTITRNPYLINANTCAVGALIGTLLACLVIMKLHKYYYASTWKYFWGALRDPVQYLVTFMAFSYIGMMIAPTDITFQCMAEAWKGAATLSLLWFTNRLKTIFLTFSMDFQNIIGFDRKGLLALNKLSSVCLIILGLVVLPEPWNILSVRSCIFIWVALVGSYGFGAVAVVLYLGILGFTIWDEARRMKGEAEMANVATPGKKDEKRVEKGTGQKKRNQRMTVHNQSFKRNKRLEQPTKGRESLVCYYCGKPGHLRASCFKIKRDLERNKSGHSEFKEGRK